MDIKIKDIKYCWQCPCSYYLDDYIIGKDEPYCKEEEGRIPNVECPNIKDGKRIKLLKEEK